MATMTAMGSKPLTADDDTKEFMRELEMSARKVLTKANKRRMDELRRQENMAKRAGASTEVDPPRKFVIEVPPGVEDWGDQLSSKTMEISSTGMTVGVRATWQPRRPRSLDDLSETGPSLPSLSQSGVLTSDASGAGGKVRSIWQKLPHISRSVGSLTLGPQPRTNPSTSVQMRGSGDAGDRKIVRAVTPAAKIDSRLTTSPLFSASMMELTKQPKDAALLASDPMSGGGGEDTDSPGGIANTRVVNASKIIGVNGAGRSGGGGSSSRRQKNKGGEIETQGVTSWSSDDLRVKYRAEHEREEAYQAFRLEEQVAEALEQDYGQAVAVPEVDRHPLYVTYYAQLDRENTRCLLRASARNKMKRFITDVHTVWLTNLSHHPEFRQMVHGVSIGEQSGSDDHGNIVEQSEIPTERRGLDGGRDSAAIVATQSQIQSVQPERAFRGAAFYSPKSGTKSPENPASRAQPTKKDELYESNDTEGGESPELPPPPNAAPILTILAFERRRLIPAPTAGSQQKSAGRGGKRRSLGGGGKVNGATSMLDACTRVLRVLRFVPPPPSSLVATSNTSNGSTNGTINHLGSADSTSTVADGRFDSEMSHGTVLRETVATTVPKGKQDDHKELDSTSPSFSNLVEPQLLLRTEDQPRPKGTWMISSFHPYNGSETRVFAGDKAVNKAVREKLAASGPIVVGNQTGERGEREGGRRSLMLRRGVRVPLLEKRGSSSGTVLSVVEVFVTPCSFPQGVSAGLVAGSLDGGNKGDNDEATTIVAENSTLEVVAYPAVLRSGECRRNCRRRVCLTAEGLWQRRRCQRPDVTLLDKLPVGLADWVIPENVSSKTKKKWTEDGGGDPEKLVVSETSERGEGLGVTAKFGGMVDSGAEKGRVHGALDDLVRMVAFGPATGVDAMPLLLLRPPQSFGPEGPTLMSTVSTAEVTTTRETGSEVNSMLIPGGTARLEHESEAEVLLSLVHLGGDGRGRDLAITVDGIATSSMLEGIEPGRVQAWEEEADSVEPLSMRVCGRRSHTREVPGTCNVGRTGLTFSYPQAVESTRAVASFFRDASISSSNSVMVVVALALDTARLTPLVVGWERGPAELENAPDEDVLGIIPGAMISPGVVLREGVVSDLGDSVAPDAIILTSAEKNADFSLMNLSATINNSSGSISPKEGMTLAAVASREGAGRRVRHRRDWKEVDDQGFRRYAIYRLLEPDEHLKTLEFGVTKQAVLPNTSAVCGRSTFHSEQRCTEQLCRQRNTKDYAYVSANLEHRGASDPGCYSVSCKHERQKALLRTGLEHYNTEMARIAVERERQAKDAALQANIQIGKAQLANRRAKEDAAARSLTRKADARNLKMSAGADRCRHKWELRLQSSHVLETRGCWEKRKDYGGSVFFASTSEEGLPEPFSWDPPESWDAPPPRARSIEESETTIGEPSGSESVNKEEANGSVTDFTSLRLMGAATDAEQVDANESHFLPRGYTEEETVSLAITRLAQNEELLGALAWRLGIPLTDVRPDSREPLLAREGGQWDGGGGEEMKDEDDEELDENREQIELEEFDDASDSDGERGDARDPPGPLPQDHSDLRRIRIAERRRILKAEGGHGHKQPKQSSVPPLLLAGASLGGSKNKKYVVPPKGLPAAESLEAQIGGLGWRRLARADLSKKFLERVTNPRTQGPSAEVVNTRPKPRPTGTADPTRATKRSEDFSLPMSTLFVRDVVEEHARVLQEGERRMKREELLGEDDSSEPFDAAKFAASGPQEFTTMEKRLVAMAEEDGRSKEDVKGEEAKAKAVIAAKAGSIADLEGLLFEEVPPDAMDSNGNTLLLLAVQQGNKRIAKLLLRKGATMNHQNMDGNTVLHYCYSIGRQDLGAYLKSKGADDSLLNSQGLTCYEGLQMEDLRAL